MKIGLKDIYKSSFLIGTAINRHMIEKYETLIPLNYNSVTLENELKMCEVLTEDGYNFDEADYLVDYSKSHEMEVRGHTLLWHEGIPDFLLYNNDKKLFKNKLDDYILTTVDRYKGTICSWDVVNEILDDSKETFFRNSKLFQVLGEECIYDSFHMAHEADPDATLCINEYNACIDYKCEKLIHFIQKMKGQNIPVHGIGLQGHYNINFPTPEMIEEAILKLIKLDLRIQITEFDISMYGYEDRRTDLTKPTVEMLDRQAKKYEDIFRIFHKYKDYIDSVTFWGVSDEYTWLDEFPVNGRKDWPLLYDEELKEKKAYYKVVNALSV